MILKLSFVRTYGCLTVFLSALLPFAELAQAAESDSTVTPNAWTRFRGPNGNGRASSTQIPVQWDAETGIQWKTPLPGPGTSSPVVWEHRMYVTCHTGYGLSRSNPGSMDELNPTQTPEVLWKLDKGSNVPTPIYVDGNLFWIQERLGILYCADADSGDLLYEERLQPSPGTLYASPIAANDLIYWVSREAGTFVVRADSQFELVAHNPPLDETSFNATPAVVGESLYLRSDQFVYCLEQ